jgi:hypothetical protein
VSDVTKVWKFGGSEARLGEVVELQVRKTHTKALPPPPFITSYYHPPQPL